MLATCEVSSPSIAMSGFYLAHHVAREIEAAQRFGVGAEGENDGRGELVVCGTSAVLGIEDVDAVPAA